MKKLLFLFVVLCSVSNLSAQYYMPYTPAQSQAYEYGRQMAEQMQLQQERMDEQSVNGCLSRICRAIARYDFDTAEGWALRLFNLRQDLGYYWLGITNELMGNESYAKNYYENGVKVNSNACRQELNRISNYGYANGEQIDNVVNYCQQLEAASYSMAAQIMDNIWQPSPSTSYYENSPNKSRATQKAHCNRCGGTGYDLTPSKYSASYDSYHNRAGYKCPYCGQTSDHYHYRCPH